MHLHSHSHPFAWRVLPAACALFCLSLAQTGRAAYIAPTQAVQCQDVTQSLFTLDHVYLISTSGPVEVTNTLSTSQGHTFAVLQGQSILIVPDYTRGTVRDSAGNLIGYTVRETYP